MRALFLKLHSNNAGQFSYKVGSTLQYGQQQKKKYGKSNLHNNWQAKAKVVEA